VNECWAGTKTLTLVAALALWPQQGDQIGRCFAIGLLLEARLNFFEKINELKKNR